jgi:hypothetical protein
MKKFVTVVAVIALLLVVGDFFLRNLAENAAAELIDEQIPQRVDPEVDLGGFPFFVSVLTGRFDEVTVRVPEAEQNGLVVEDISLTFRDARLEPLEVLAGRGDLRAASLRGRGVISEEALTDVLRTTDPSLTVIIEDGRVAVSRDGTTIAATAVVAANRILFQAGEVAPELEIPLPELLPDIQFSSLRADSGELVLGVVGNRVRIRT